MAEQRIQLHVLVPPTCEHGLSRRALIGKTAFLCHALGRNIPLGNDELHPMNFGALNSNRAASSKYTLFGLLVGCKPPRWLESMVPERANSVYGIYALTWKLTSTEKGLPRAECFFSLKGLCIW